MIKMQLLRLLLPARCGKAAGLQDSAHPQVLNFVFTQAAVQHTRRNLHQQFGRTRTRNSNISPAWASALRKSHSCPAFFAFCECRKFSGIL